MLAVARARRSRPEPGGNTRRVLGIVLEPKLSTARVSGVTNVHDMFMARRQPLSHYALVCWALVYCQLVRSDDDAISMVVLSYSHASGAGSDLYAHVEVNLPQRGLVCA